MHAAESEREARQVGPVTTLADIDILAALDTRPGRAPDYEREHRAVDVLTAEMAARPHNLLQRLVEVAVDLCGAGTAGISLLDGDVFRWEAIAGAHAAARGVLMPRTASPCGVCIERDGTQLMYLADRYFPAAVANPRFVEILLVPFHERGRAIGTVWVISHTAEQKFDREDERLMHVLARFASVGWQLWQTAEDAVERARRKDEFLALAGHELRNPLSAIIAGVMVMQQQEHDPEITRAIEVVARQARHVTRLIDDMLDLSRAHSGKLQMYCQRTDLRTAVVYAVDTRRTQLERRRQHLTVDVGDVPVWVQADPIRLEQMVSNLLDNASKYTRESGEVFVAIATGHDQVSVSVRDTGMGVPAEGMQRIFEPFVRLPGSDGFVDGGLGLGLALVRDLAELHGGSVDVSSPGAGQGSCFTVRLPRRDCHGT